MRNPFAAFKDPDRRMVAWLWTGVIAVVFAGFYAGAQMATSTRWFCEAPCHGVHAQNTRAYDDSPHSEVSCIPCHYQVNMNPVSFALDRADKLLDILPTITDTWEKPLNGDSHMAFNWDSTQCTQCHKIATTQFAPSSSLDFARKEHDAHTAKSIGCAICHNRIGHLEKAPTITPGDPLHENWQEMKACFRCHSQTKVSPSNFVASGNCDVCHPKDFALTPATHKVPGWAKAGHGKGAMAEAAIVTDSRTRWDEEKAKFYAKQPRLLAWLGGERDRINVFSPPAATIFVCSTCHTQKFCEDCHKMNKPAITKDLTPYFTPPPVYIPANSPAAK
jgi:hypothetical protein